MDEITKRRFTPHEAIGASAAVLAAIAALFCVIVSTLLVANYLQVRALAPIDNPEIQALYTRQATAPETDAAVIEQLRALDLLGRRAFFTSQSHQHMGGYLLLAGVVIMLLAWRTAAYCRPQLPAPEGPVKNAYWAPRRRAKLLIGITGGAWVAAALLAAYGVRVDIPALAPASAASAENTGNSAASETPKAPEAPPAPQYPDWAAMQTNWPSFRGPGGYGVAHYTTAPVDWDAASGKNIAWKTDLPLPGRNSPVVWGDRIYLCGATEEAREVFCFDAANGQLRWRQPVGPFPGTPEKSPRISEETGYGPSTMVVHGDFACAIFVNGDLVCFDKEGKLIWGKNLGVPENHYGHSSSLIAYANLLFVQYDQRRNSKLLALDLGDGHEVWTAPREKISWASPVCVQTPSGMQLVLDSEKDVDAYDPITGQSLWKFSCLDGEVAPSPAYGGGLFFVANDNAVATAIRLSADTPPKPEKAWEWDEALPDISSPVGTDTHFYLATSRGDLVCLDSTTGTTAWMQELDEGFSASPIVTGDRIYATDVMGKTYVFKTGAEYSLIGTPSFGEPVMATPAFMDGRIYCRTETKLLCVEGQNAAGS